MSEPTTAEKIVENLKVDRAMLSHCEKRASTEWYSAEMRRIDSALSALATEQADIERQHGEAPMKVAFYAARVERWGQELAKWNNRGRVDQLKRLQERVNAQAAELAKLRDEDPEAFAKVAAMLGLTGH